MKQKELKQLTINEFGRYQEILKEEEPDILEILELFGYDIDNMSISDMYKYQQVIQSQVLPSNGIVEKVYKINGRRFKACLNLTNINAAQFIDFQNYLKNFKLEQVLSVFLIPMYRNWYGRWVAYTYSTGYDAVEVMEYLKMNMTIGEANQISSFFLNSSLGLLKVMKDYSAKKYQRKKLKMLQKQQKARLPGL